MEKISIFLNREASNTSFEYWKMKIQKILFRSELVFHSPKSLEDLNDILAKDIKAGADAIISVGGDGTVNTLIQHLANSEIGLLVIPGGTANDLARELSGDGNISKILSCIRNNESKKIDLIQVNGRYMATNGGIGLGGQVAKKINTIRKQFPLFKNIMKFSGKRIYSLFVAQELLTYPVEENFLEISGDSYSGQVKASAILINNQSMLAGTFNIAPETSNSDGMFNVSIATHPSRAKLIKCILSIAIGKFPNQDPYFKTFETRKLQIKNLSHKEIVNFFGDGEIFHPADEWVIKVQEKSLKVYAPDDSNNLVDLVNEVSLT